MEINLDIITACINKERRAEFEMYKLLYRYLMSICMRYTNNEEDAKEKLNLGFTRILFNLEKYRPEVPFKKWVRRVMINILIDEYRKEQKEIKTIEYVEEYTFEYSEVNLNEVLVQMNVDQIHSLITKLPSASQKVFNLYVIDGFNHREIGDMMNISEGTSKWHLNFSRNKLKEMLANMSITVKLNI
jgi:RNA polymerase sigma factor (sigma-70 family)